MIRRQPEANTDPLDPTEVRVGAGVVALCGGGLLVTSELVDRLERLEDQLAIGWFNLAVAVLLAIPVMCAVALAGDSLLAMIETRLGHRPGPGLVTTLLGLGGVAAAVGILAAHLHHPLALDSLLGLGGSLLLMLSPVVCRHRRAIA